MSQTITDTFNAHNNIVIWMYEDDPAKVGDAMLRDATQAEEREVDHG